MKQTIEALEKEVANYEYHYRVLDNPIVSDQVFDFAKKKLEKLSAEYPQFVTSNSPLNKIIYSF